MDTYDRKLKKTLQERGEDVLNVAQHVGIKKGCLQKILDGERKASLDEIAAICAYLSLDVNDLLDIKAVDNEFMLLNDDLQISINKIVKNIKKEDQKSFIKAVGFLADCFLIKEKNEIE